MTEIETIDSIRSSTREIVQYLGYLNNLFAHIGSVSQCHALLKLEKNHLTPQELSMALDLESSTVSRLAQSLVNKGYCVYQPNKDDRRSRHLKLTKLGRQKLLEIHAMATQQVELALQSLSKEEKETISKGLSLYAKALKNSHSSEE